MPAFTPASAEPAGKHPFLVDLGDRTRALRVQRGLSRKALSSAAQVSERHLANLEYGVGNVSVLVLLQVAQALKCPLADLLDGRSAAAHGATLRSGLVALVGLRGAGKTTLGQMLAEDLEVPFIELSREVEKLAGCSTSEIQSLYGQSAYRRYERRALEEATGTYTHAVVATPGGLVSDPASFKLLLAQTTTVWLQAKPEDHMARVMAQGDLRPMAGNSEALSDLKSILAGRAAFYSRAEFHLDTSDAPLETTFAALRRQVRQALALPT